ncbi:biotin-dependent carboxyltransferase family protein [Natroniella sulfidigena]|uniref:5-oxoprolinase subunit C family protein n=1 Tax=Natroniella sulfidigena TaxID=723921 RepID=UPI00200AC576|nr:biotin-dependent carboxyltransferase family protein [Natroniella sulfidigena]MCK8816902.1 biotin-dependent carboxyltransferase family protein [Natroniella sulfidigena]
MGELKIIKAGPMTTIQDLGRFGYMKYGMPTAGAVDQYAFKIANILVGNPEDEAAIEATFLGPTIQFKVEAVIAITGGGMNPELDGKEIPMWQAVKVSKGSKLSLNGVKAGLRGYIAIRGGIKLPEVMGSKSTYLRGELGGFKGRKLKQGDELSLAKNKEVREFCLKRSIPADLLEDYLEDRKIRVIVGPQGDYFTSKSLETFLTSRYQLTTQSDRMGCRLAGPTLEHTKGADIISDGIASGAIQVPGDGQPIIMLADRQTTGGYAKIANVISIDLPKVAQAKPGDKLKFEQIEVVEAQQELKKKEERIARLKEWLATEVKKRTRYFKIKVDGKLFEVEVEEQ